MKDKEPISQTENINYKESTQNENVQESFDLSKAKEAIPEPSQKLQENIFPQKPDAITKETLQQALEKLLNANIDLSPEERVELFTGALEYFSKPEELEYPIGHGTGSDSLRLIIDSGVIKAGGTGEQGEATHMSFGGSQKEVSVAEMKNDIAEYVTLMYARSASDKETTADKLLVNTDTI